MKGYTQIKKEDVLKAIEKFDALINDSYVAFTEFKHHATEDKQEFTVGSIFKRKKMMTLYEHIKEKAGPWWWREIAPKECQMYLSNEIDPTKYKQQALIAEEYVNCDTELSAFVYKYLNWEKE